MSDCDELYEAFTPYGKKYGAHPDEFFFDAEGHMVLAPSLRFNKKEKAEAVLDCKVADTIECVSDKGIDHHARPQLNAPLEKPQRVKFGQQLIIKKRCEDWVKDNIGWMPLVIGELAVFQIVSLGVSRVPVMAAPDPCSP